MKERSRSTEIAIWVMVEAGRAQGSSYLSPAELNALETAAALAHSEGVFGVASLGGDPALLREAAAFGACRAVLFETPSQVPAHALIEASAKEITGLGCRLLLCGDSASGGGSGLFGAAMAGALGFEMVFGADSIVADGQELIITRRLASLRETIKAPEELVVALRPAAGEPRASLQGVLAAAELEIEHIRLDTHTLMVPEPLQAMESAPPASRLAPPVGQTPRERVAELTQQTATRAHEPRRMDPEEVAAYIFTAIRKVHRH